MWTSNVPYVHTQIWCTHAPATHTHSGVSRAVFANDEVVCIQAPLLFHRLETLTQINRQHGPALTISVSTLLPASLHSPHHRALLPPCTSSSLTSALISQLHLSPPLPPTLPLPVSVPSISHPLLSSSFSPLLTPSFFFLHQLPWSRSISCSLSSPLVLYTLLHISPLTSHLLQCPIFTLSYVPFSLPVTPTSLTYIPRQSSISCQTPYICSFHS